MSGPSGERCGYCYYVADPSCSTPGQGWCKRFPPPHTTGEKEEDSKCPAVSVHDWCGEFRLHPDMRKLFHENMLKNRIFDHMGENEE